MDAERVDRLGSQSEQHIIGLDLPFLCQFGQVPQEPLGLRNHVVPSIEDECLLQPLNVLPVNQPHVNILPDTVKQRDSLALVIPQFTLFISIQISLFEDILRGELGLVRQLTVLDGLIDLLNPLSVDSLHCTAELAEVHQSHLLLDLSIVQVALKH